MRCPRCHLGTLELQHDGTIYLCRHCKYIRDNESAQFVTTEQYTESLRNMRITTQTIKIRRPIKRSARRKPQIDAGRLKELKLLYSKYSRQLRGFSLPDKTLLSIWKRSCSAVVELYLHIRNIMTDDSDSISSINANFIANAALECQSNGIELNASSSSIFTLLVHAKAMAIATYVFAAELAGRLVMPSCIIAYLKSRDVSQKPPSLLLVSRCYRILPVVILPPVTRARLLFDVRAAFTQIASLCLVFQGYRLDNSLIATWVSLSMRLSTLYPRPLCGFHAFIPISTSAAPLNKGTPHILLSPCRYTCIFLLLAYISITLSCSKDEVRKYHSAGASPLNLTIHYHNTCVWSFETAKFFKNMGFNLSAYRPFNLFPLEEFVGLDGACQSNTEEDTDTTISLDDIACMLAAICELNVERFVRSSLEVARAISAPLKAELNSDSESDPNAELS